MKRLDEQLPVPLFDVDKADGTKRNASAGIKRVDQFILALT